ncbi:hypothetical protein IEQ34_017946 [Dendrobium chrysotoxum]|uniref:Non-specific serine/threonine protein kinase n=1 Tax=Dendrobium chrysotoxum TaxID=161865 RepID=A0AAV7GCV8_DENCH|nr:hypothetical protein IEQ34_017946 [Dendrobium chrysotoxum]
MQISNSRNHLDDSIPQSISSMQSLTTMDFSYNNLSGLIPGTSQFIYFNSSSFLGNPELCGPYLGPCRSTNNNKLGQAHWPFSYSFKLILVIVLLLYSIDVLD